MSKELIDPEFHARLARLIGDDRPFAWADKMGIPKGTFSRVWNDGGVLGSDHLKSVARATGVSIDWLLTGEGPMMRGETRDENEIPLDGEIYMQVTEEVLTALEGRPRPAPAKLVLELIRLIHDEIKEGEMRQDEIKKNVVRILKIAS